MNRITKKKKKNQLLQWVFFAVVSKNAAISHILRHFFGPPLYMRYIVAFNWTATIDLPFCGLLQQQNIKPPQYIYIYIYFSDVGHSYSCAPSNCCNRYIILWYTTKAEHKTTAMNVFQQHSIQLQRQYCQTAAIDTFLRHSFLVIAMVLTTAMDPFNCLNVV